MTEQFKKDLAKGKALRAKFPRLSLATWSAPKGRVGVVEQIKASDNDRLPLLIPVRHQRMKESPFVFYRATAGIMAADLAGSSTKIPVQAIGDCHLMNFGGFATPERTLVFDANDFDETCTAPWEWDLKRLAASFVLAGRARGMGGKNNTQLAFDLAAAYRDAVREYAQLPTLDLWYLKFDFPSLRSQARTRRGRKLIDDTITSANASTHNKAFYKITQSTLGRFEIKDNKPLVYHPLDVRKEMDMIVRFMDEYKATLQADRRFLFDGYHVVDVAMKVVGVGSVGTRCFVVLLMNDRNEPLFLQVKEARPSVLAPYAKHQAYAHQGKRIVEGQRLVQAASDMFLGWTTGPAGRQFYVRQLRDRKVAFDLAGFDEGMLTSYARLCGRVLARAHVRTGNGAVLSGYIGGSDAMPDAIAQFAPLYADQTEKDHAVFVKAEQGRGRAKTPTQEKVRKSAAALRRKQRKRLPSARPGVRKPASRR